VAEGSTHPAAPPYATIVPEDTAVQAGGTLQVQCLAHGTPPLHYTWDKVNGSLSTRVAHRAGLLRLGPAAPADTGTYRCLVTNRIGTAEAFARVAVHGEPSPGLGAIGAPHWVLAALPLECLGLGEPRPHVTWSKVGGRIRPGVLIRAGTLTIEQVERADAGQYRCTATNAVGTVQSHVILHVQGEHRDAQLGTHAVSLPGGDAFVCPQLLLKSLGSQR
uniref:Ig-like domain-containing protein n=1 Tax=Cyanistes caeruleus TaxID=156563 RepID=A0A8C0UXF2_CYACU